MTSLTLYDTDASGVSYRGLDAAVVERSDSQFPRPTDDEPTPVAWFEPS